MLLSGTWKAAKSSDNTKRVGGRNNKGDMLERCNNLGFLVSWVRAKYVQFRIGKLQEQGIKANMPGWGTLSWKAASWKKKDVGGKRRGGGNNRWTRAPRLILAKRANTFSGCINRGTATRNKGIRLPPHLQCDGELWLPPFQEGMSKNWRGFREQSWERLDIWETRLMVKHFSTRCTELSEGRLMGDLIAIWKRLNGEQVFDNQGSSIHWTEAWQDPTAGNSITIFLARVWGAVF